MRVPGFLLRIPGVGRLLRTVGVTAVPTVGFFAEQWPVGTVLLLYWMETILITAAVTLLVALHRQTTRKAGHWNVDLEIEIETNRTEGRRRRRQKTTFLKNFLSVMVPFTLAHGVFVLAFAFLVFPDQFGGGAKVSMDAVRTGLIGIAVFILAGLLLDIIGLGQRPFRWIEEIADRAKGRMFVTHLTLIFGAVAMAAFDAPLAFFAVFVVLKAMLDLGELFPTREPAAAPRLPTWVERKLPVRNGKTFVQAYSEELEVERRKREANEQVVAKHRPAG